MQFRIVAPDHPITHALILFQGTLAELRAIAFSFPPDLLDSFKPDPPKTIDPEPDPDPNEPGTNGNGAKDDPETTETVN